MDVEPIVLPILRHVGNHPRVSRQLFRFAKWGDPFAPERFSDPYAIYDTMTAGGPVVHSKVYQQWFVSGYDEVLDVLRSPHASTAAVAERMLRVTPYTKLSPTAVSSFTRWLLVTDPPDHTRLRTAVNRAFAPKRIAESETRIRAIVGDLSGEMDSADVVDIVAAFTSRLPIYAIAELLGLPEDKWEWLHDASGEIGVLLEVMVGFDPASMSKRFEELHEYFGALVDERRTEPQDDLISALASAEDGDVLDNEEVIAMIGLLLFAGHETTTGMLGNSIVALANSPDQRALLRANPELIDNALDELLRFDTTAQFSGRTALESIEVGGHTIPKGASIALMFGQANRDRRRWPDADLLRLDRLDPKPISFGHGIHRCLGAALARLEMRLAIPALLDALGDYTVDLDTAEWKRSHTLRGPTKLNVTRGVRHHV